MTENYFDGPNSESIRSWGYDENAYFSEQDEDLALAHIAFVPDLIALAEDPDCPKNDYACSILYFFSREAFLLRKNHDIDNLIKIISKNSSDIDVAEWITYVRKLQNYYFNIVKINYDQAAELAEYLLVGKCKEGHSYETKRIVNGYYEFAYKTQIGCYRDFIYIDLETADWKYSKREPLNDIKS